MAASLRTKMRVHTLFAFGFLMFTGASWAQFTAIEGDVKGPDGKPLVNAQILIEREDMKGTFKGAKTDKKGHYIYNGLPVGGTFTVSVFVDGQKRDSAAHQKVRLGDPIAVNFDLKAAVEEQKSIQKTLESGGQLTKEQERGMTKEQKEALEKHAKENAATMAKNKALNDTFNAGKEALAAKNYDAAVQAFEKGSEMDPNQNVVWANLADAYIALAATKTGDEQTATMTKGLDAYVKALALKPDDAAYHNNYALALARAKKYDDAQNELNKAAQLDPSSAGKYYYNLGAVLVNTGQTDPALAAFKKATEADPNYADAQFQYATVLSSKLTTTPKGEVVAPPGMKEALEKYLALAPTGPYAEASKALLQAISTTVQTNYTNPDAPKKGAVKKKP
jgi:tetratricopeptide (TPR) repeat protein